jgi:hypothetical protein
MADDSHHGKSQHDERYVAVAAVPGAGFVMIEAEFVLGGLEAVLDGPAMAFHRHQLFQGRALGAPGGEEGQVTVGDVATDQKASCPFTGKVIVVFIGLEIGQLEIGPVVQARSFGAVAR